MISFIDLSEQRKNIKTEVEIAISKVLEHGQFILGPEVKSLEEQLSSFCGTKYTITCANGTDALALVLMALGIKTGDAVFVPAFTFVATAEVVAWLGATPVFVDVDERTYNIDPEKLENAAQHIKQLGLTPKAVIPVDLFGLPADYKSIKEVAERYNLSVLADAAQSFGGSYQSNPVGTFGLATATSFFPSKPLGCYGDGGAIFTDDSELAQKISSMRSHGKGSHKYENTSIGMNSRLDTLQAAILLEKLKILPNEIKIRQEIAYTYTEALKGFVRTPHIPDNVTSAWAQYTIQVDGMLRTSLIESLKKVGIPTAIYYPIPLNAQRAYQKYPCYPEKAPISEALAASVLSLPMHPYLSAPQQEMIIDNLKTLVS